ncbi:MAG: SDR family oxidoreductase [Alphaproteobacteria bacterium]|nr:SDR family oxidoreductase [Alphaproteobacteria bacterium]
MPTILITGANRGIGLGIARLFVAKDWHVIATCRRPDRAEALRTLARQGPGQVTIHALEVGDLAAVDRLGETLRDARIDILLNNAGIMNTAQVAFDPAATAQDFGHTDPEEWMAVMRVNVFGPMRMNEVLVEPVARSERKVMVTTTSIMGSIAQSSGRWYHYRTSKTAVNMMMRNLAVDLKGRGITCFALHPGAVRTEMNSPRAQLSVEESASGCAAVLERATLADTGKYLTWNGSELPW